MNSIGFKSVYIQQDFTNVGKRGFGPSLGLTIWQKYFINSAEFDFDFGEAYKVNPEELCFLKNKVSVSRLTDKEHFGWKLWRGITCVALTILLPLGLFLLGVKVLYHLKNSFELTTEILEQEAKPLENKNSPSKIIEPISTQNISLDSPNETPLQSVKDLIKLYSSEPTSDNQISRDEGWLLFYCHFESVMKIDFNELNNKERSSLLSLFFEHASKEQLSEFIEQLLTNDKYNLRKYDTILTNFFDDLNEQRIERLLFINLPKIEEKLLRNLAGSVIPIPVNLPSIQLLIAHLHKKFPESIIWDEIMMTSFSDGLFDGLGNIKPTLIVLKMVDALKTPLDYNPQKKIFNELWQQLESLFGEREYEITKCLDKVLASFQDFSKQQMKVLVETLVLRPDEELSNYSNKIIAHMMDLKNEQLVVQFVRQMVEEFSESKNMIFLNSLLSKINCEAPHAIAFKEEFQKLPTLTQKSFLKTLFSETYIPAATAKNLYLFLNNPAFRDLLKTDSEFEVQLCNRLVDFLDTKPFRSTNIPSPDLEEAIATFFYELVSDLSFKKFLDKGAFNLWMFKNLTKEREEKLQKFLDMDNPVVLRKLGKILSKFKKIQNGQVKYIVKKNDSSYLVLKNFEKFARDSLFEISSDENFFQFLNKAVSSLYDDITEERIQKIIRLLDIEMEAPEKKRFWEIILTSLVPYSTNYKNWNHNEIKCFNLLTKALYTKAPYMEVWVRIREMNYKFYHNLESFERHFSNYVLSIIDSPI